ncbi:MAG: hypothetical protein KIT02_15025 [Devosia sp.]|uniref:hypothetical protein n=1 Tax=Devosia sp. TaxID=1871048 RepID=UPI0024C81DF1|nr:hypothetical protein [Devosia sp.]UYN99216.1 MAG: hypothetical protein KIT02_15025 [Devosia sp.]
MALPWTRMMRETGAAFAVLAIYVLTLLLPLHQAAGLQRDLNAMGYSTLESWSVCQPLAQDEDGQPVEATAVKCPATGVSKHQLAAIVPPAITIAPVSAADVLTPPEAQAPLAAIRPDHVGQSRAPPVSV